VVVVVVVVVVAAAAVSSVVWPSFDVLSDRERKADVAGVSTTQATHRQTLAI
jgi:hypothetical protein